MMKEKLIPSEIGKQLLELHNKIGEDGWPAYQLVFRGASILWNKDFNRAMNDMGYTVVVLERSRLQVINGEGTGCLKLYAVYIDDEAANNDIDSEVYIMLSDPNPEEEREEYIAYRLGLEFPLGKPIFKLVMEDLIGVMAESDLPFEQLSDNQYSQLVERVINKGLDNIGWTECLENSLDNWFNEISKEN